MRNPDSKSRRRGRVSWGEARCSQQLGWGRPGRTAGVLPLLQGAPGQRWAILVLLLLGLSLAGLTDHTFPQTLRSPDGPALDLGCLLWGLYGFGGRASRLGRMWGPRAGRCRGGARLPDKPPGGELWHPGCQAALVGVGRGGAGEGEPVQHRQHVYTRSPHLRGKPRHLDAARGGLPPLAPAFSPAPSPAHSPCPLGPHRAPGDAM